MSLLDETLYLDSETLSLNPYNVNAKIITIQIGKMRKDKTLQIDVYREWEYKLGESELIMDIIKRLSVLPKYTPIFTYNGLFDLFYLIGRCNKLNFDNEVIELLNTIFTSTVKHCDLMQYDNGYFISLDKLCIQYKIDSKCVFKGKDINMLYEKKDYNNIISHGEDDIERLYRLVNETNLADRFYKIQVLKTKW